ncbi:MAG: MBL fold metallo-hydrolase [Anaerolineae bacterium]
MKEIAPGVYVETGYSSGNVGAIATGAGLVCVDLPMRPKDAQHWLSQLDQVSGEPVVLLVQTDYDRTRVLSTGLLDVPLIAHDATWPRMRMYSSEKLLSQINEMLYGDSSLRRWQVRMPDMTFSERLMLHKGRHEIHVLHGGGHSPATCMVHLPEENLLFSGDVLYAGVHPSMSHAVTRQWLSALTGLRKMSVERIVPGPGEGCDKGASYPLSEYIRGMRAAVRRHFRAGRTKSETSSSVIPQFMDVFPYADHERDAVKNRVKGGSDRIYDEYRAAARAREAAAEAGQASRRRKRRH